MRRVRHRTSLSSCPILPHCKSILASLANNSQAVVFPLRTCWRCSMAQGRPTGEELTFSIRTVHLSLAAQRPAYERNVWPVKVERSVFQGDFTQTIVLWGDQRVTIRAAAMAPLPEGSEAFMPPPSLRMSVAEFVERSPERFKSRLIRRGTQRKTVPS